LPLYLSLSRFRGGVSSRSPRSAAFQAASSIRTYRNRPTLHRPPRNRPALPEPNHRGSFAANRAGSARNRPHLSLSQLQLSAASRRGKIRDHPRHPRLKTVRIQRTCKQAATTTQIGRGRPTLHRPTVAASLPTVRAPLATAPPPLRLPPSVRSSDVVPSTARWAPVSVTLPLNAPGPIASY